MARSCPVCCLDFGISHSPLPCPYSECSYLIGMDCWKRWVETEISKAMPNINFHCLGCKKPWYLHHFFFIRQISPLVHLSFPKPWIQDFVASWKTVVLQRHLIPNVQQRICLQQRKFVTSLKHLKCFSRHIRSFEEKIGSSPAFFASLIEEKINPVLVESTDPRVLALLDVIPPAMDSSTRAVGPCPYLFCNGILHLDEQACASCSGSICTTCLLARDVQQPHQCLDSRLAHLHLIQQTCTVCPTCGTAIERESGCSNMFCIKCKTCFNYDTFEIQPRNDNPLFESYLAGSSNGEGLNNGPFRPMPGSTFAYGAEYPCDNEQQLFNLIREHEEVYLPHGTIPSRKHDVTKGFLICPIRTRSSILLDTWNRNVVHKWAHFFPQVIDNINIRLVRCKQARRLIKLDYFEFRDAAIFTDKYFESILTEGILLALLYYFKTMYQSMKLFLQYLWTPLKRAVYHFVLTQVAPIFATSPYQIRFAADVFEDFFASHRKHNIGSHGRTRLKEPIEEKVRQFYSCIKEVTLSEDLSEPSNRNSTLEENTVMFPNPRHFNEFLDKKTQDFVHSNFNQQVDWQLVSHWLGSTTGQQQWEAALSLFIRDAVADIQSSMREAKDIILDIRYAHVPLVCFNIYVRLPDHLGQTWNFVWGDLFLWWIESHLYHPHEVDDASRIFPSAFTLMILPLDPDASQNNIFQVVQQNHFILNTNCLFVDDSIPLDGKKRPPTANAFRNFFELITHQTSTSIPLERKQEKRDFDFISDARFGDLYTRLSLKASPSKVRRHEEGQMPETMAEVMPETLLNAISEPMQRVGFLREPLSDRFRNMLEESVRDCPTDHDHEVKLIDFKRHRGEMQNEEDDPTVHRSTVHRSNVAQSGAVGALDNSSVPHLSSTSWYSRLLEGSQTDLLRIFSFANNDRAQHRHQFRRNRRALLREDDHMRTDLLAGGMISPTGNGESEEEPDRQNEPPRRTLDAVLRQEEERTRMDILANTMINAVGNDEPEEEPDQLRELPRRTLGTLLREEEERERRVDLLANGVIRATENEESDEKPQEQPDGVRGSHLFQRLNSLINASENEAPE